MKGNSIFFGSVAISDSVSIQYFMESANESVKYQKANKGDF